MKLFVSLQRETVRGVLSVCGCFLVQLVIGSYHGTFGNLLPYFASYLRQDDPRIGYDTAAQILSVGGLGQGVASVLAGLIFIPTLGSRGCLLTGSVFFVFGHLLTYWSLDWGVVAVSLTYGLLGGMSVALTMAPSILIPCTWFPHSKGKISGLVFAGFGLSATVFSSIQSLLINPTNLSPMVDSSRSSQLNSSSSQSLYFIQSEVLTSVPTSMLLMAACYSFLLILGLLLSTEKPIEEPIQDKTDKSLISELKTALSYLIREVFTSKDFYLLLVIRILLMVVVICYLAHWKTLLFTVETNDMLVSMIGMVNGIMNCLSRLLSGFLLDIFPFPYLMSLLSMLLSLSLLLTYPATSYSLPALLPCMWMIFALCFAHFTTIPAQIMKIFKSPQAPVAVSVIGVADTFSYSIVLAVNHWIMSRDSDPKKFLWLLLTLSVCSLISMVLSFLVSNERKTTKTDSVRELENFKNVSS